MQKEILFITMILMLPLFVFNRFLQPCMSGITYEVMNYPMHASWYFFLNFFIGW